MTADNFFLKVCAALMLYTFIVAGVAFAGGYWISRRRAGRIVRPAAAVSIATGCMVTPDMTTIGTQTPITGTAVAPPPLPLELYVAPVAGERFHCDPRCRGLTGACKLRKVGPCRFCMG
jgi:hypothetical protein